jgi:hypothetical protein
MRLTETLGLVYQARRYVADDEGFVARQKTFVDRLERSGQNSSDAQIYLNTLEEMQAEYEGNVEKLERQVLRLVKPMAKLPLTLSLTYYLMAFASVQGMAQNAPQLSSPLLAGDSANIP